MKKTVSAQKIVSFLNDLLKRDPVAISNLFLYQSTCNDDICKTKTFVLPPKFKKEKARVRFIGVLNGLLAKSYSDPATIVMITNEQGSRVLSFKVLSVKEVRGGHGRRDKTKVKYNHASWLKNAKNEEYFFLAL